MTPSYLLFVYVNKSVLYNEFSFFDAWYDCVLVLRLLEGNIIKPRRRRRWRRKRRMATITKTEEDLEEDGRRRTTTKQQLQ